MNKKYSVPVEYIGRLVNLRLKMNMLEIYSGTELIAKHEISNRRLNYQKDHYTQLLSHYVKDEDAVAEIAENNLQLMDQLLQKRTQ